MEIAGKRLQLLKEAVPKISRVAVFSHVTSAPDAAYRREIEAAARPLGVKLQFYSVRGPEELARAFTGMSKTGANALFVVPNPAWAIQVQRIIELAAQSRLPAMYPGGGFATAGGLMSYDVDAADSFRRLAPYVHKILNGANPADLPVEQPIKFELVINLKTAKALGLTIPPSLSARADEVIE